MDLTDGFYQILMRLADVSKTAVSTPSGMLWEWLVMPQGLKNAPATFNRVTTHLLRPCRAFAPSYFDDIYIHSRTSDGKSDVEMHRLHLREVLTILRANGLYANLKKCIFGAPEIPVLGDFVGIDGVRADPEKIRSINEWPVPSSVKDLRKWLGLANYLHKYTPNYAALVRPLSNLLKKETEWLWSDLHQTAFEAVKTSLTSAPILALPDFERPFTVVCDASDFAIGCCLMQIDAKGVNRAISYQSRQLKAAELNYPVHDRELLAMKYALVKFRIYLLGSKPFIVYTDHASLRTAVNSPHLSQRMARWLSFFAEYSMTVEYKPGRENVLADALSRRPDWEPPQCTLAPLSSTIISSLYDRIRAAYMSDPTCSPLVKHFTSSLALDEKLSPRLRARLHRYSYRDELLFFAVESHDEPRIVVPFDEVLRLDILHEYHDTPVSGHLGREKTYLSMSRSFWWPRMYRHTELYVRSCDSCQRVKPSPSSSAPLQSLPIPTDYWKSVSMDFVFGLPPDPVGNTGIIVFVDRLSKCTHMAPVKTSVTGPQAAAIYYDLVFRLHGMPETLVSDRDPRFTGFFWQALMTRLGSRLAMSTADHPQTDGQTERVNRVLEDILRATAAENPKQWSALLPSVEFSINNAVHASTGFSPFFLLYGRHPRLPVSLSPFPIQSESNFSGGRSKDVADWSKSARSPTPHSDTEVSSALPRPKTKAVAAFVTRRLATLHRVRDTLAVSQDKQKELADRHGRANSYEFKEGDMVLVSTQTLKPAVVESMGCKKLLPRFIGPFKITARISNTSYRLDIPKNLQLHPTFYVGRLKPYVLPTSLEEPRPSRRGSHLRHSHEDPGRAQGHDVDLDPDSDLGTGLDDQDPDLAPNPAAAGKAPDLDRGMDPGSAIDPDSSHHRSALFPDSVHAQPAVGSVPSAYPSGRSQHATRARRSAVSSAADTAAHPRSSAWTQASRHRLSHYAPRQSDGSPRSPVGQRRRASLPQVQSRGPVTCDSPSREKALSNFGRVPPRPIRDARDDLHYHVEKLLDVRETAHGKELLVRWLGYPPSDDSWESLRALQQDVPSLVAAFLASLSRRRSAQC
jgi:hypothetical protein